MRTYRWLFPVLILLTACQSLSLARHEPTVGGGCQSGIEYQGQAYSGQAVWQLLGINVQSRQQAIRDVKEVVEIYLHESANLCDLYRQGALTGTDYADRRAALGERFAKLVELNKAYPVEQVAAPEAPFYSESLAGLNPMRPERPVSLRLEVSSQGRVLQSGDELPTGATFRLWLDLPQSTYLYIVLLDSEQNWVRLYPAKLTGTDNPVKGAVAIPADPDAAFEVYGVPGEERLLIFAQSEPSRAIENLLAEVDASPAQKQATYAALARGVRIKQGLLNGVPGASQSATSKFGQAALEFVIRHVPPLGH